MAHFVRRHQCASGIVGIRQEDDAGILIHRSGDRVQIEPVLAHRRFDQLGIRRLGGDAVNDKR